MLDAGIQSLLLVVAHSSVNVVTIAGWTSLGVSTTEDAVSILFAALTLPTLHLSTHLLLVTAGLLVPGLVVLATQVRRQLPDHALIQLEEHLTTKGWVFSHCNN